MNANKTGDGKYQIPPPVETSGESAVALIMKPECEKCKAALPAESIAWICSYECTFCEACKLEMKTVCPNCGGELVRRPRRRPAGGS